MSESDVSRHSQCTSSPVTVFTEIWANPGRLFTFLSKNTRPPLASRTRALAAHVSATKVC